jgi:hypothetical protein
MTAGVYGIVAAIIKADDLGHAMSKKKGDGPFAKATRGLGRFIAKAAPPLINTIGVVGTVAMFLVGGGMVMHGLPGGEHLMTSAMNMVSTNAAVHAIAGGALETVAGLAAGFVAIPVMRVIGPPIEKAFELGKKLIHRLKAPKPEPADADEEAPSGTAPAAAPANDALKSAPDVKADLNAAAKTPANDTAPPPAPAVQKPIDPPKPA